MAYHSAVLGWKAVCAGYKDVPGRAVFCVRSHIDRVGRGHCKFDSLIEDLRKATEDFNDVKDAE